MKIIKVNDINDVLHGNYSDGWSSNIYEVEGFTYPINSNGTNSWASYAILLTNRVYEVAEHIAGMEGRNLVCSDDIDRAIKFLTDKEDLPDSTIVVKWNLTQN